jgi:hypothetical protein
MSDGLPAEENALLGDLGMVPAAWRLDDEAGVPNTPDGQEVAQ